MQGKSAVRIRRKYVVGVQNQHTAGRQAGSKFFTVAGKKRKKEAARISYQQHAPLFRLVNHASGHGATLRVSLSSGVLLTVPFPAPAYSYAIVHFLPSRYPSVHHAYR